MRHWENLIVKFLMTTVIVWLVGSVTGSLTFGRAVLSGVVITLILYFLWDLLLLPGIGNAATAVIDGITAAIILAVMEYFMTGFNFTLWGYIATGAVLAVGEYFLHRWFIAKERPGEKT